MHDSPAPGRARLDPRIVDELCRLKREVYADFSVRHFHEFATRRHKLKVSYTWTRMVLQARGLVNKAPSRGKYRRKRERRPMVGMLVHQDASTHAWIKGLPMADLVIMLDDADGKSWLKDLRTADRPIKGEVRDPWA